MDSESDNISYARTQLSEARRRLDSIHDRVVEVEESGVEGVIMLDMRTNEMVTDRSVEDVPDEHLGVRAVPERTEVRDIETHIQNIIIDCQMCIELSVKSMFKTVGQDFDYSHGITFESHNTKRFNKQIPEDFPRQDEIVRSIFLTQLWEKFYTLAKYGAPELDVGPSVIFEIEDGERAINDAEFCVGLAEDFLEFYVESQ